MPKLNARHIAIGAAIAAVTAGGAAPAAFARHGADDRATHDRGDDHGGQLVRRGGDDDPATHDRDDDRIRVRAARHGADDRRGDDRGGRRHHKHARVARHGADDPPGDARHGDDGPNHR